MKKINAYFNKFFIFIIIKIYLIFINKKFDFKKLILKGGKKLIIENLNFKKAIKINIM